LKKKFGRWDKGTGGKEGSSSVGEDGDKADGASRHARSGRPTPIMVVRLEKKKCSAAYVFRRKRQKKGEGGKKWRKRT